ncbi:MAG TPA: hypothetical protein VF683_00300 [Chthoniobacterales bacterium]
MADQFGIGRRTGGFVERAIVDDVEITPRWRTALLRLVVIDRKRARARSRA